MAPYTGPDGVPGALDYMSFSTALYGESDLWTLSVVLARDHQPTLINRHVLRNAQSPPSCSFFGFFWYVSGLIFLSLSYVSSCFSTPPPVQPLHRSLTLCLRCICFPRNAAALQVYKEGETKIFFLFFIFLLSLFFFMKWIKLTYFIILNKKGIFLHLIENKRQQL